MSGDSDRDPVDSFEEAFEDVFNTGYEEDNRLETLKERIDFPEELYDHTVNFLNKVSGGATFDGFDLSRYAEFEYPDEDDYRLDTQLDDLIGLMAPFDIAEMGADLALEQDGVARQAAQEGDMDTASEKYEEAVEYYRDAKTAAEKGIEAVNQYLRDAREAIEEDGIAPDDVEANRALKEASESYQEVVEYQKQIMEGAEMELYETARSDEYLGMDRDEIPEEVTESWKFEMPKVA